MNAHEISNILEEIALLLELNGESQFKSRAYRNAARSLKNLDQPLEDLVRENRVDTIKGIGKGLAEKISEGVLSGEISYLKELRDAVPAGLLEMVNLPGLGPRKVIAIHEKLDISTIGELEYACRENRLMTLDGFGKKTQDSILKAIEFRRSFSDLHLRHHAQVAAESFVAAVSGIPCVEKVKLCGSLRRGCETIKTIDIVAVVRENNREEAVRQIQSLENVQTVTTGNDRQCSIALDGGFTIELCMVENTEFTGAIVHSTGSPEHISALRTRAEARGMVLNEYGLLRQNDGNTEDLQDEPSFYEALELPFIEPELREGLGEIEAAEADELPDLLDVSDIKGMLHIHTTASDGVNTVRELADAAVALGAEYLGICDHSRSATYAGGLSVDDLHKQWDEIDEVNAELTGFRVLKGIESDILSDGRLDYDDTVLEGFDFVIASIHSGLKMSAEQATERVLAAIRHPAVSILGHPTGRLLLAREGYPVDLERVIEEAATRNVAIELNASPHRLDLDWRWCRRAREAGVRIAINPDAHSIAGLNDVHIGVKVGRKGWLEPADVINTLPVSEFLQAVHSAKS